MTSTGTLISPAITMNACATFQSASRGLTDDNNAHALHFNWPAGGPQRHYCNHSHDNNVKQERTYSSFNGSVL